MRQIGDGGSEAFAVAGDAVGDDATGFGAMAAGFHGPEGVADTLWAGSGEADFDPAIDDEVKDARVAEGQDVVAGGEGEGEEGLTGVMVEEMDEISDEVVVKLLALGLAMEETRYRTH
jgi:hypothetical protein